MWWPLLAVILLTFTQILAQHFSKDMSDKNYFDLMEMRLRDEVKKAQSELMMQVDILENVTTIYIAAKMKEDEYKVMSLMHEKKLGPFAPPINYRQNGKFPSKLVKQDEDVGGLDPDGLEAALKVTGTVFKELLLIPKFFRETLEQVFMAVFPKRNMTMPKIKTRQIEHIIT